MTLEIIDLWTEKYKHSIFMDGVRLWNNLPGDVKDLVLLTFFVANHLQIGVNCRSTIILPGSKHSTCTAKNAV